MDFAHPPVWEYFPLSGVFIFYSRHTVSVKHNWNICSYANYTNISHSIRHIFAPFSVTETRCSVMDKMSLISFMPKKTVFLLKTVFLFVFCCQAMRASLILCRTSSSNLSIFVFSTYISIALVCAASCLPQLYRLWLQWR